MWARAGITRVGHVLDEKGEVMSTEALLTKYPALSWASCHAGSASRSACSR